jgi:hypothetical protein
MKNMRLFSFFSACALLSAFSGMAQSPVFTNAAIVGGYFQVQVLIASNQLYTIETSTNLTAWTPVGADTSTNGLITLVDPRGTAGFNRQFYRLVLGAVASYNFFFLEFANAGSFNSNSTPDIVFPVSLANYSATFEVDNDTNYPPATNVFFTGPAGSGFANAPADPNYSNTNVNYASYQTTPISSPAAAPGGTWVVNYKGANVTNNVPDPQAASRLVVPYPTLTVSGGVLQSVSWVYRDATTGTVLSGPPAYMSNIQLQVYGTAGNLYNSPNLTPDTTSDTLTSLVNYSDIAGIGLAYQDSLGNNYVVVFGP